MVPNAQDALRELLEKDPSAREEYARDFKLKNDPRVTRIGALLRKTSLDEIPQLFNVLRGEMSLMGPRPIVEDEKKFYNDRIADYMSVKPGITGLWQVSGRSDTGYDQRVYLDSWYVRNWSFWNDVVIGFRTFLVVLARKGAY
jgi:undecaprenyl-phosphate galactose phosphotransferase